MRAHVLLALLFMVAFLGCAPSPQEKYDAAERKLEQSQSRLDNLRPAYDAAQERVAKQVCKEIVGSTLDDAARAAIQSLHDVAKPSPPNPDATKDAGKGKRRDELDATIDNLIAAEKDAREKQAALTEPLAKANEVMEKIKTPGTPENKRFEEKLATTSEAEAYERQKNRVEKAQEALDEAKAELK